MKRFSGVKTVFIILFLLIFTLSAIAFSAVQEPTTVFEAAILIDSKTGQILYSKNATKELYPASITKIMTAILVIDGNPNYNDKVTASKTAISITEPGSSSIGTSENEVMTVDQLLHALLLNSANECANILAEYHSGSIDKFVSKMNSKALELGATHTHFNNTNGLPDENHYTSAYDMALIAQYAMKNEKFRKIVSTTEYSIPPTNMYKESRILINRNQLINTSSKNYYKDAIGIKTGYTSKANHTFVGAAKRNGIELIAVLLNGQAEVLKSPAYDDAKTLFEYGFENFVEKAVVNKNAIVKENIKVKDADKKETLSLIAGEDVKLLVQKGTDIPYVFEDKIDEEIQAPIVKGTEMGTRTYTINGKTTVSVPLLAASDIELKSENILVWFILFVLKIFGILLVLLAVFIVIMLIWLKLNHKQIRVKVRVPEDESKTKKVEKEKTSGTSIKDIKDKISNYGKAVKEKIAKAEEDFDNDKDNDDGPDDDDDYNLFDL